MKQYPINLNLYQKKVLVVGGGKVAYRKIKRLVKCGSIVKIVCPDMIVELKDFINNEKNQIEYFQRKFLAEDLNNIFLAVAATDDSKTNKNIGKLAQKKEILVNVVDNFELSDFTLPAVVDREELMITISTGGSLPALSSRLCKELEEMFGPEFEDYLKYIKKIRPLIVNKIDDYDKRKKIFYRLAEKELINTFKENKKRAITIINDLLKKENIDIKGGKNE